MTVNSIVELQAKPGKRAELLHRLRDLAEKIGPILKKHGNNWYTFYEAVDDADMIIEINEWETREGRESMLMEVMESGVFTPMMELMAAPPAARYLKPVS